MCARRTTEVHVMMTDDDGRKKGAIPKKEADGGRKKGAIPKKEADGGRKKGAIPKKEADGACAGAVTAATSGKEGNPTKKDVNRVCKEKGLDVTYAVNPQTVYVCTAIVRRGETVIHSVDGKGKTPREANLEAYRLVLEHVEKVD